MARLVTRGQRTGLYLTDYRDLIRELNRVQPSLSRELQRDFKRIAQPAQIAVQNKIPYDPPTSGIHKRRRQSTVSGFYPRVIPGRLTWSANGQNNNVPVKSVKIETPSSYKASKAMRRNPQGVASIARLRVDNAAVVLADMAKKPGKQGMTREYYYSRSRTGKRRHFNNGQGVGMLGALTRRYGKPSRFAWKGAEEAMPKVRAQTRQVLGAAYEKINRRLAA